MSYPPPVIRHDPIEPRMSYPPPVIHYDPVEPRGSAPRGGRWRSR
jgi:hypothetical protein